LVPGCIDQFKKGVKEGFCGLFKGYPVMPVRVGRCLAGISKKDDAISLKANIN
jgi:hypothetical protein